MTKPKSIQQQHTPNTAPVQRLEQRKAALRRRDEEANSRYAETEEANRKMDRELMESLQLKLQAAQSKAKRPKRPPAAAGSVGGNAGVGGGATQRKKARKTAPSTAPTSSQGATPGGVIGQHLTLPGGGDGGFSVPSTGDVMAADLEFLQHEDLMDGVLSPDGQLPDLDSKEIEKLLDGMGGEPFFPPADLFDIPTGGGAVCSNPQPPPIYNAPPPPGYHHSTGGYQHQRQEARPPQQPSAYTGSSHGNYTASAVYEPAPGYHLPTGGAATPAAVTYQQQPRYHSDYQPGVGSAGGALPGMDTRWHQAPPQQAQQYVTTAAAIATDYQQHHPARQPHYPILPGFNSIYQSPPDNKPVVSTAVSRGFPPGNVHSNYYQQQQHHQHYETATTAVMVPQHQSMNNHPVTYRAPPPSSLLQQHHHPPVYHHQPPPSQMPAAPVYHHHVAVGNYGPGCPSTTNSAQVMAMTGHGLHPKMENHCFPPD